MKKYIPAFAIIALAGVLGGAILTASVSANPLEDILTDEQKTQLEEHREEGKTFMDSLLTDEQKAQLEEDRAEHEAMREEMEQYRDNITREVTKTDNGIQINLTTDDAETLEWMHNHYDEGGFQGEGPGFGGHHGPRGGMGGFMGGEQES